MTAYFAPPGEPLDGGNWTELGMIDADGPQFEENEKVIVLEIKPQIQGFKTRYTESFSFTPSKELVINMLGFDIYALRATVAEWINRPAPMPSIPKTKTWEIQDGINRILISLEHATNRYALEVNP